MTTEAEFLTSFATAVSTYDTAVQQAINDRLATLNLAITSFSPTSGYAGEQITITGSEFGDTQGSSTASMGTSAMSISSWSDTQIVASVVSGAVVGTQLAVSVTTAGGSVTAAREFTITPGITSFSPASGPDGTNITIVGSGFGSDQGDSTLWLGNGTMTVSSWSDTQIIANFPGYSPGLYTIELRTGSGDIDAPTQFEVTSS